MRKLCLAMLAFTVSVVAWTAGQEPPPTTAGLDEWVRQSTYIFRGKVQRLNASNLKVLPPAPGTAVVLVENVLDAPKTFGDFTGKEVTVQLREPNRPAVQEDAIFFTNGWLYGENIAVTEVAHQAVPSNEEELRRHISALRQKMVEEKLQGRIARSTLVVAGRVTATQPVEKDGRRAPSEHAPDWWKATVAIDTIVKGQTTARQIEVLFPKSTDEMWLNSPKFEVGEQGVWILQSNQKERGLPALRVPGLTALDPLDFWPTGELPRIKKLVNTGQ